MPNFFTIKDGWSLDEQLGNMLRELDGAKEASKAAEFQTLLKTLMQDYKISDETLITWIERGIVKDGRV